MNNIIIRKDLRELSRAAAELFLDKAAGALRVQPVFSVALAGGSTPLLLYQLLASEEFRAGGEWSRVKFFFGDERNVPPESPESNYRMARKSLLEPLKIDEANVVRWETGLAPEVAAANYEKKLADNGPLDLILLGLGNDAHTASLFPRTEALRETVHLAVANWVEKLKEHRLTITFPAINSAMDVVFIVAGREKADAVAEVLEGESDPSNCPAKLVRPRTGNLYWLLDKAAAEKLANK